MAKGTTFNLAELVRLKCKYRSLVLKGKLELPPKAAALLIGPDCAYHLYSIPPFDKPKEPAKGRAKDRD